MDACAQRRDGKRGDLRSCLHSLDAVEHSSLLQNLRPNRALFRRSSLYGRTGCGHRRKLRIRQRHHADSRFDPDVRYSQFHAPFDAGGGIPQNTYDLVGRVDFNPTAKTQMFFRGGREASVQLPGSNTYSAYPQYDTGLTFLNQSYLYSISHIFTPSLFLSAKVSYTRFNENTSFDPTLLYVPNLMFVTPTDPNTGSEIRMPGLENSSEPGQGGLPAGGPQNTIQLEPDLSWTKGKHSMRFGFLDTYIQLNYASALMPRPSRSSVSRSREA